MKLLPARPAALLFAGSYALLSVGWIVLSDNALDWLFRGGEVPENAQTLKGIFFVGLSTLLAYLMVSTERQRAHLSAAEARESATRFRLALHGSRRAMWEFDPETQRLSYSSGWELHLGSQPGAFDGSLQAWAARAYPEDVQAIVAGVKALLAGGIELLEDDVRFHHASGRVATLRVTAMVYSDTVGKRKLIGAFKDVTEARRHELSQRERREAQDRLARLASAMPGLLCSVQHHPDGRITMPYASERLVHFFGLTPEQATVDARSMFDLVEPGDQPVVLAEHTRSRGTGTAFHAEYRVWTPHGLVWVEQRSMPHELPDGSCVWHGYLQDITSRHRAAEALAASEQRTRAHLENVPVAVLVTDRRGRYIDANPAACALTGHSVEALRGMHALDLVWAGDRERIAALFPGISSTDGRTEDLRIVRADQSILHVRVRTARLDDGDAISWIEDVTPERLTRAMLQAQVHMSEVAHRGEVEVLLDTALDHLARHTESGVAWVYRGPDEPVHLWSHSHPVSTPDRASAAAVAVAALDGGAPAVENQARPRTLIVPVVLLGRTPFVIGLAESATDYTPSDVALAVSIGSHLLDLADSVKAHVGLLQSEAGLSRAQEIARMGSWSLDLCTDKLEWSKGLRHLLGVPAETPADLSLLALHVHPDDQVQLASAWREAIDSGTPHDTEVRLRADGVERWIRHRVELQHDEIGRVLRAIGTLQDVTERHVAQARLESVNASLRQSEAALSVHRDNLERLVEVRTAALEAAEHRTRLLLESTAEGIFGVDAAGKITFANRAASNLLGYDSDSLSGCDVHAALHDSHEGHTAEECPLRLGLAAGRPFRMDDERFWRKDGESLPVSYALQPLRQDGVLVGGVVNFSDITARRIAEAALTNARDEAQRLAETRSAFLANMSHEIRTPLNAVLGLAQVGMRDHSGTAPGAIFDRIVESGQLLMGVVNDILDYSKIEAGKLALEKGRFELGGVIDRALDLTTVPVDKSLNLSVEEAADLPRFLEGDSRRLVQVLVNLLSNAVKFTGTGGSVVLGGRRAPSALVLFVRDSGIGITAEQRTRLFRPFEQADSTTTRRYGGTGLGLSISNFLVSQMGGHIEVYSELGVGSVFEVHLPCAEPASPAEVRTVCLLGLGEDLAALEAGLQTRGVSVVPWRDAALPDILVLGTTALEASSERIERMLAANRTILVAARTGDMVPEDPRLIVIPYPLRPRHVLEPPRRRPHRRGAGRLTGLRVLGVEDNPANQLVLKAILSREGSRLVCVGDGHAALEILTTHGPGGFDLVLTDISMPGIDGYETARRIHALAPSLPVIALTAHALPEDRARCLAAGMVGYLTKPIEMDALVSALLPYMPNSPAPLPPSVEVTMSTAPLINWTELASTLPGGATFLLRLTKVALDTQSETPARLRAAGTSGDALACRRLSHDFVSTAGAFGMTSVVVAARAAEAAARDGTPEMGARVEELAALVDAMLAELRAHQTAAP